MSSKTLFNDEGVLKHANVVHKVFDLYRKAHHFSLEKVKPGSTKSTAERIDHIPESIVSEAFDVYCKSGEKSGSIPHPNYFVAVARRLYLNSLDNYNKFKYNAKLRNNLPKVSI